MRKMLLLVLVILFTYVSAEARGFLSGIQLVEQSGVLTPNASGYALSVSSSVLKTVSARTNRIDLWIVNISTHAGYVVAGDYNIGTSTAIQTHGLQLEGAGSATGIASTSISKNSLSLPGYTGKVSLSAPNNLQHSLDIRVLEIWK